MEKSKYTKGYFFDFMNSIREGKQKNHSRKLLRRSLSSNKPSCENDAAKIQINRKKAIGKLRKLKKSYTDIEQIYGFLSNLKTAIGLNPSHGASEYAPVEILRSNGTILIASISISNHPSNAKTYIEHDFNYEYNLRIVVKRSKIKRMFVANKDVVLDEFDYTGKELNKVNNALSLIIQSIIDFLETGVYVDLTGVAVVHRSPKEREEAYKNPQK
ncbi:MAG: hypothetical protein IJU33_00735 [Bacteroidales bacterium]|nr:hypothetical protein [Bacteroidales bacterium]